MKNKLFFTITEVAYYAKVDPLTVAFRVGTKQLHAIRIGARTYIHKSSMKQLMEEAKSKRQGQTSLFRHDKKSHDIL